MGIIIDSKEELIAFMTKYHDRLTPEQYRSILSGYYSVTIWGKPYSLKRTLYCIDKHEEHLANGENPENFHTGFLDFVMQRDLTYYPIWSENMELEPDYKYY